MANLTSFKVGESKMQLASARQHDLDNAFKAQGPCS